MSNHGMVKGFVTRQSQTNTKAKMLNAIHTLHRC
jgi:hypothetical protein